MNSTNTCATMRPRLAPSAVRTANSDARVDVCARINSPTFTQATKSAAQGRTGAHGDRLAEAGDPRSLTVPTLIYHGPDDTLAPWRGSRQLAARRPDLVTLHTVARAPHAAMWNADPKGYEEVLRRFLTPLM
jgi:pimeloyl-ACP methyl ester carboxylesterase